MNDIAPRHVVLTQLVTETEPTLSQVVVSGEQFYFVGGRHHEVDQGVDLLRLLRLLPNLCNDQIVRDFRVELDVLVGWALVPYEAGLATVQEVEAMADVNFVILGLDPSQLVDDFVAPLVHAFVADVHLRIEDPQEAEALGGQVLDGDVDDLLVAHGAVLEVELVVRKHEARVVSLGALNSPGWVDVHHLKVAELLDEVLEVEEPEVTVDVGLGVELGLTWSSLLAFALSGLLQVPRDYLSLWLNRELQPNIPVDRSPRPVASELLVYRRIDDSLDLLTSPDRLVGAKGLYNVEEVLKHFAAFFTLNHPRTRRGLRVRLVQSLFLPPTDAYST